MTLTPAIGVCLALVLVAIGAAFFIGRFHPAKSALEDTRDDAYLLGYDHGRELEQTRQADPYPDLCPDPGACEKGPDPNPWTTDCEQDEGWADLDEPPPNHPVYRNPAMDGERRVTAARLPSAEERTQMFAELAPDDERPAGHTDQFRAIDWDRMPWSERQGLIEWDFVMKSRRLAAENDEFIRDYLERFRADVEKWRAGLENRGAA